MTDPGELWRAAVERLTPEIGKDNVDLWLTDVEPLKLENGVLTVRVPNKFFTDQIGNFYQPRIQAILKGLADHEIALDYVVERDLKGVLPPADPIEAVRSQSQFDLSELNPRWTFESFVVGTFNRLAHATAEAVAKSPGRQYNPVFLYGGVGLGKTHLMHAIGHLTRQLNPNSRVLYTTSEQFVNEYIDSIRNDKPDAFRGKYRNLDCLLIDDIQFLIGRDRSEEEFFYTFNTLFESRKQIVISSDRAPKEMAPSEQRLISRFMWGQVVDIKTPDLETRIAILRKKAASERLYVQDEIVLYLASAIKSNIRELEGALIRVSAFPALTGKPLTLEAAKELVRDSIGSDAAPTIRIDTIQREVAEKYSLDIKALKSKSRRSDVAFPRQLAMYLACTLTELSTPEIGRSFGGRDHTTVIHARDKIKRMLESDPFFVEMVNKLVEKIRAVDNS
ncbi:MAG: chromosomal replication initiator protein DnaA [Elusimicrobiota bacterium]